MATIVIVHGMFDGGWSWRRVAALLRAAGHEVHTPTLTGLGERVHLAHPEIDLETHIADIVNLLYFEDLSDVRLIGHSYAGCVITGVADRAHERLASLIYLDAHVPENGESFLQLLDANNRAGIEEATRAGGEGWRVPPPAAPSDPGVESHPTSDLWAWFHPRLLPHPFKTLTQPLRLTRPPDTALSRAYILCAAGRNGAPLEPRMERIRTNPAWRWREIDADHLAHVTAPEMLANALLELV
ncbi:MAG TPA: alpha/beta fold hydrolase [Ktedonobacterales bacterium]